MFHRRWHSWKQTPYRWYNLWKCTLTRSISSPFPPLTLKPCFLQMALNANLPHPCRIGEPHRFRAGGKIRSGPQVGEMATSPLPYRGAPPLQSGGQNQKWPTSGQIGYLTPAVSGSPTAAERGAKSEVAHKWANWLPHPCRIGEPHRCRAGGKIGSGPQVGKLATSPLPYRGSPPLQSGGQNQKGCPKEGGGGRHGPRSARAKRPLGAVLKGCP